MGRHPDADKGFGQHFLVNQGVIDRIAEHVRRLSERQQTSRVIEIGPGPGALTKALLARDLQVHALELDQRMVEHLNQEYGPGHQWAEQLKVHHCDALEFSWAENEISVIAGNLPYNVGTTLVFEILEKSSGAQGFCFMLQREVVQRFVAKPRTKDYGHLSVVFQLLCETLETFWVQPGSFQPPPKVQSGVISFYRRPELVDKSLSPFSPRSEFPAFLRALKKAFQSRRKMLRKAFPALVDDSRGSQRPEELSPTEWWELWKSGLLTSHS